MGGLFGLLAWVPVFISLSPSPLVFQPVDLRVGGNASSALLISKRSISKCTLPLASFLIHPMEKNHSIGKAALAPCLLGELTYGSL